MNKKYSGQDRRRFQRLDLNIVVSYRINEPLIVRLQVGEKEIEATMLNLSEGGMGLLTSYNIPRFTLLNIKFTLSRMDKQGQVFYYGPMEIAGEVRSNASWEKDEYRLGICFIKIDEKDRAGIRDFVKMTLG